MRLNETEMVKLLPAWMQEDGGDKDQQRQGYKGRSFHVGFSCAPGYSASGFSMSS